VSDQVVVTGLAARSAFGPDTRALLAGAFTGEPAFRPVRRFDAAARRSGVAATLPGDPVLADELVAVVDAAHRSAGGPRTGPLLLAAHADRSNAAVAADVAARVGMPGAVRTYTAACVAASSAVADAAAMIAAGRHERVVVAAGFLVDEGIFALFDAGRVLARDDALRPFSSGRLGMVLGDAAAAVVLESASAAAGRGARVRARLAGWGRCGDAYHVCQPRPDGTGMARAIGSALDRAGVGPEAVGYVNANGTGTVFNDAAEAAALRLAFGEHLAAVPVSSTKSVHGHALEATGLLELVITVLALETGRLPVNAGYLGPDADCPLDVVVDRPRPTHARYALSVNAAFGGANTALLVGAP
jgi:3-oxoacyl-[acyl-carrier-protein] synthase II